MIVSVYSMSIIYVTNSIFKRRQKHKMNFWLGTPVFKHSREKTSFLPWSFSLVLIPAAVSVLLWNNTATCLSENQSEAIVYLLIDTGNTIQQRQHWCPLQRDPSNFGYGGLLCFQSQGRHHWTKRSPGCPDFLQFRHPGALRRRVPGQCQRVTWACETDH